jgi:hypothetical protein
VKVAGNQVQTPCHMLTRAVLASTNFSGRLALSLAPAYAPE